MSKKPSNPQKVTKKYLTRKQQEEKQVKTAVSITIVTLAVVAVLLGYVLIDRYIVKPNVTVASVGDTEIKAGDFQTNTKYARMNMLTQATQYVNYFGETGKQYAFPLLYQLQDPAIIGENVLNQLIDEVIIREEAAKRNITVSDEEVQALLREQFAFYPEGTYTPTITSTPVYTPTWSAAQIELINPTDTPEPSATPTETPEGWQPTTTEGPDTQPAEEVVPTFPAEEAPTSEPTATTVPTEPPTPTPYTERLFKQDVKEYVDSLRPYGISRDDIEQILYNGLLREKLIEDVTKDLRPEEEQVWVRHILVENEDLANEVIEKLAEGEEWQALAAEYSTDESNKDNGGDLGWIGREDSYDETFLKASFDLEDDGQISEPVETQFGWHIIQLVTKAANPVTSSKFNQLKQAYFTDWLEDIRTSRDDIQIESAWVEFAPTLPAVPEDLYNYVISPNTQGN